MLTDFKQVKEAINDAKQAASTQRVGLAMVTGTNECYYEGIQYLNQQEQLFNVSASTGRIPNLNPDVNKLRMVQNEITRAVIKVQSFTYPSDLEVDIQPPPMDSGVSATMGSDVMEKATETLIKSSGYLDASRECNNRRAITGVYGLGWHMMVKNRIVGMDGQQVPMEDRVLKAFTFHPLRLLLDPANQSKDLRQHSRVIYQDVWDIYKLRATFPNEKWDESQMSTIGQLTPYEQEVSRLSGYRLFGRYYRFSQTKGARIYQVHEKGDDNWRFNTMWVAVEMPNDDMKAMNPDNPVSPFGHDGLPLAELHGHPRADSRWSISDVGMVRDWQDQLNLFATWNMRAAQKFAVWQFFVDKRWFGGRNVTDESIRNQLTNRIGGVTIGSPSSNDRSIQAPQKVDYQPPPPYFQEMMGAAKDGVTRNSFRSEVDYGNDLKSHTSDKLVQTYRHSSDEVLAIRVNEDRAAHSVLLQVGLGTLIANVQAECPSPLGDLRRDGFKEDDIVVLLQADPMHPCSNLEVSESSIRHRTSEDRRRDLLQILANPVPVVDAMEARQELAELDMSLTGQDKRLERQIRKDVCLTLSGQPWIPKQLGKWNDWAVNELIKAQFDESAKRNPKIAQVVQQAIEIQRQIGLQATQQAAMAAEPQPPEAAPQAESQPQEAPPDNLGQLLDKLAAG